MSDPPPLLPSGPRPVPGTRPPGMPTEAERQADIQLRQQQQRLRALESERKEAALQGRAVLPHFESDEAWAEFQDRRIAVWREEHARVVEWWISKAAPVLGQNQRGDKGIGPDDSELISVLKSVQRAQGCCAIAMGHSLQSSDSNKLVVIEWVNIKAKSDFYANFEALIHLTQALQHANFQRLFTFQQQQGDKGIFYTNMLPPQLPNIYAQMTQTYEIWITYFPADLPVSTIKAIEKRDGPPRMGRNVGGKKPYPLEVIMEGDEHRSYIWAVDDAATEYRSRPARRMIYGFVWRNEQSKRLYKEKAIWRTWTRDGGVIDSPTDGFVY